jgi:hypothetical protein
MTPAAHEASRHAELPEPMRADLAALLADVTTGELSSADFYDRLTQIHTLHLRANANTPTNKTRRAKALRAFEHLGREAPSRHHELELIAAALGVHPESR